MIGMLVCSWSSALAWTFQGVIYEANDEDRSSLYGTIRSYRHMQHLKEIGVNTLSYAPSAFQKDMQRPEIFANDALDPSMEKDIVMAKRLGFNVLLRPSLRSIPTGDDSSISPEPINMRSEEEWRRWFANYERMIVHYAVIAQKLNVDIFVIGDEYDRATRDHTQEWARIIRNIRAVYPGRLTYSSRNLEEARRIRFWPDLDLIGVSGSFRVSSSNTPSDNDLQQAWSSIGADLALLSKQNADRPIILTELGYYSVNGTSQRPMLEPAPSDAEDLQEQQQCYQAALGSLKDKAWLSGIMIWKYKVSVTPKDKSRHPYESAAVFQDKPAETVVATYFKPSPEVR